MVSSREIIEDSFLFAAGIVCFHGISVSNHELFLAAESFLISKSAVNALPVMFFADLPFISCLSRPEMLVGGRFWATCKSATTKTVSDDVLICESFAS